MGGDVTVGCSHRLLYCLEPVEPLAPAITDRPWVQVDAVAAVVALDLGVEAAGGVVSFPGDVAARLRPHQTHATNIRSQLWQIKAGVGAVGMSPRRRLPYAAPVSEHLRTYGLLWTALNWAAATLRQTDRVRTSFESFQAARPPPDGRIRRVTPESQRPGALFWADVHFLMISVRHLDEALVRMGTGPRLSKATRKRAVTLRHLVEHWWDAYEDRGAWKSLRERHGEGGTPTSVGFVAGEDLKIGPDSLSVVALAEEVRQVERELVALELELG
jgi:hypothetical protein